MIRKLILIIGLLMSFNSFADNAGFDTSNSVLLEFENGVISAPMIFGSYDTASNDGFVGTENVGFNYLSSPTSTGTATVSFQMTGTVDIWIRRTFFSSDGDSFWVNLKDHDASDITEYLGNNFVADNYGQSWLNWNSHDNLTPDWHWEKYATVNLNGSSHKLTLMSREDDSFADVVLITQNLTETPDGIFSLSVPAQPVEPIEIIEDWSNGYGSTWFEMFDDDSELSGNVRIDNGVLVMDDILETAQVTRLVGSFDLTDLETANITIDVATFDNLEVEDSFFVNISVDGGATWSRILTMTDDYTGNLLTSFTPASDQDTLIKLLVAGFNGNCEQVKINSISINN